MNPPMETAWELAREGVVLYAGDRITYLNPVAAGLLGVERERVVGRPLLLALRDHKLEALCRAGGEASVESRGRTLLARAAAGVLLLLDQTEERSRGEALEESSRVLAHEFRTPVAGMLSLLEALREGLPEPERGEALGLLYQEAQRLGRLVEDLPLTRVPGGERTFGLEELRPRLERFLAPALAERGARLEWRAVGTVRANPDAVYQALLNLLDNALKYGPGGAVEVVTLETPQGLRLEVRDGGKPLPDFERLFRPGQRGVHAANVRGTGLGLALVRRLAAAWGGEAYGRGLERGNAFGLTFPRRAAAPDEAQPAHV